MEDISRPFCGDCPYLKDLADAMSNERYLSLEPVGVTKYMEECTGSEIIDEGIEIPESKSGIIKESEVRRWQVRTCPKYLAPSNVVIVYDNGEKILAEKVID